MRATFVEVLKVLLVALAVWSRHGEARGRRRHHARVQQQQEQQKNGRAQRLLSLFTIVNFKNDECTTISNSDRTGTCFTATECTDKGGTADGNCAAGFGVCCLFEIQGCDGTVSQNCSYIQNEGYPTQDTTTEDCEYTINRPEDCDLCQIRLDFVDFNIPLSVNIPRGDCTAADSDSLAVTSGFSGSAFAFPSPVCGNLDGQHMYFETGDSGDAGTITINKGTSTQGRNWNVKVTFLECGNLARAPEGCTQYFTGTAGTIQSYNYNDQDMLADQEVTNCIRQEEGYCSFQVAASQATTGDSFQLSAPNALANHDCRGLSGGVPFGRTYIMIPNLDRPSGSDKNCGGVLNNVQGESVDGVLTSASGGPFVVIHKSQGNMQTPVAGFSLDYVQIPC